MPAWCESVALSPNPRANDEPSKRLAAPKAWGEWLCRRGRSPRFRPAHGRIETIPAGRSARTARDLFRIPEDVEDALHDALLVVWEKRASFDPRRHVVAWLWVICRNGAVTILRTAHQRAASLHDHEGRIPRGPGDGSRPSSSSGGSAWKRGGRCARRRPPLAGGRASACAEPGTCVSARDNRMQSSHHTPGRAARDHRHLAASLEAGNAQFRRRMNAACRSARLSVVKAVKAADSPGPSFLVNRPLAGCRNYFSYFSLSPWAGITKYPPSEHGTRRCFPALLLLTFLVRSVYN